MTKQQENRAFVKMLKEFPKAFGRVSFRERLMLRTAFNYVVEEVIADIKANCDLAIEGKDVKIMELEQQIEKMKNCWNCDNWNWKQSKCNKKLKGDCFKASKWQLRR